MLVKIFLKGNAQFVKNEKLPSVLSSLEIDRFINQAFCKYKGFYI